MEAMKAKEKEMKDEKEAERKVRTSPSIYPRPTTPGAAIFVFTLRCGSGIAVERDRRADEETTEAHPGNQGEEGRQGREGAVRAAGGQDAQEEGREAEEEGEEEQDAQLVRVARRRKRGSAAGLRGLLGVRRACFDTQRLVLETWRVAWAYAGALMGFPRLVWRCDALRIFRPWAFAHQVSMHDGAAQEEGSPVRAKASQRQR